MSESLHISTKLLEQIFEDAERRYPSEACGFLLAPLRADADPVMYMPCRNVQDELHTADPERYPRTSATAYAIDSTEKEAIEKMAKETGLRVSAVVHSHPDHEAYFSAEDKSNAAPWGEPLFPGVSYVVVSVFEKNVKAINEFYWDEKAKEFMERKVQF